MLEYVNHRISRNDYFMEITKLVAKRSTCLSTPKGAIIIKDNRIIATGYSGAPMGVTSCYESGKCLKRDLGYGHGEGHDKCLAVHAEANAILQAASLGIGCKDCVMYCTHKPCADCAKMIINSGIKMVIYKEFYPAQLTDKIMEEAGVGMIRFSVWLFFKNSLNLHDINNICVKLFINIWYYIYIDKNKTV